MKPNLRRVDNDPRQLGSYPALYGNKPNQTTEAA
jgi:hypothetical protein